MQLWMTHLPMSVFPQTVEVDVRSQIDFQRPATLKNKGNWVQNYKKCMLVHFRNLLTPVSLNDSRTWRLFTLQRYSSSNILNDSSTWRRLICIARAAGVESSSRCMLTLGQRHFKPHVCSIDHSVVWFLVNASENTPHWKGMVSSCSMGWRHY